jgi:hypothetical protein
MVDFFGCQKMEEESLNCCTSGLGTSLLLVIQLLIILNQNILGSSPTLRIKKTSELLAKRSYNNVPLSRRNGAPGHADDACYQRRCSGTANGEGRRRAAGPLVGTGISMGDDTKGLHPSLLPQAAAAVASSTRRRQGHQKSAVSSSAAVSSGHSTSFSRNSSEDPPASPETTVDRLERKKPSSDDPDDNRSDSSALDVEAELSDASSGSLNGSNEKPTTLASRSSYSSVAGE